MSNDGNTMTKTESKKRAKKLCKEINRHDYLYYVKDDPEISDAKYDKPKNELIAIEKQYPDLVTPDSPTRRVGGEPHEELGTVNHESRMLSLQAVYEEEAFGHFCEQCSDKTGKKRLSLVTGQRQPVTETGEQAYGRNVGCSGGQCASA
jgi:DNA ligase (NAD+)